MNDPSIKDAIRAVALFSELAAGDVSVLEEYATLRRYELGQTVLSAGDPLDGVHVVRSGRCRCLTVENGKERTVRSLSPGEMFGASAVLSARPSEYAIRASDDVTILYIRADGLRTVLAQHPEIREVFVQRAARSSLRLFLAKVFDCGAKLDGDELKPIVESVRIMKIGAGEKLFEQDSETVRDLFIVRSGEIRLTMDEADGRDILSLRRGEIFGERACLDAAPQQTGAEAVVDSILLAMPRDAVVDLVDFLPGLRGRIDARIRFVDREMDRLRKLRRFRPGQLLVDVRSRPGAGRNLIGGFRLVEQAEERDCGAACLAMICRHHDIPVTLGRLREMIGVDGRGADLDAMARTGEAMGFFTRATRCNFKTLLKCDLPFIAHWEGYHYIVVYGISKRCVWVADPAKGFRRMSVAEFERGWTGHCLLLERRRGAEAATPGGKPSPWRRFVGYVVPFKKILGDLLLAALIIQVLGLAPPLIIQNILDRVIVQGSYDLLNLMIAGLAVAFVFRQITRFFSAYLMNFMVRKLDFNMISQFYRYVLSLPIDFFARRQVGDIVARFHENNTVRRFMTQGSITTLLNTMMIFTFFIVMFLYNVRLTLMLMAFLPPIVLVTLLATPKYKDYARKVFFAGADAQSTLVETLGGAEIVKAMGVERPMRLRWEKQYLKALDLRYRAAIFTAFIGGFSALLQAAAVATLLWMGTRMVLSGELTIGQLIAFHALIGSVMAPVMGLVSVWDEFQEALVSMERLGDVLDLAPEQKDEDAASRVVLPDLEGDIRLENVYFRYGGPETPYALKNIDLTINAGATVAIVGPSGSGKSTLARLIVGFYPPTEGRVYVDDYDVRVLDFAAYRRLIGYVMERNALFSGTVSDNIAVGDTEPDMRRIIEAARMADADGFIRTLPMGYSQVVGERGAGLSGGQIQRVCLARALYHDPKILILDEATSALDSETERRIQLSMKKILKGRTAVVIAHRLSTIVNADQIVVMYDGAVAETGSHDDLLEAGGIYYSLVRNQMNPQET